MEMNHFMKYKCLKHTTILISVFALFVMISGCASAKTAPRTDSLSASLTDQSASSAKLIKAESTKRAEADNAAEPQEEPAAIAKSPSDASSALPDITQISATVSHPEWAAYFGELNGAAVILDPEENTCQIYNEALAGVRRSPCSTFKIISSLAGLENSVIDPDHSIRSWSGETFWNDDWNQDMDFSTAFHTSCVWYYRQVIDDLGPDTMQKTLDALHYGNCDITDWEGHLNNNNNNPSLTGFWIESSLKICPREQAAVMKQIFDSSSAYSPDTLSALEEVMFLSQDSTDDCKIYGKTGMGKSNGIVVDAWYTGFADADHRIYFCVYLGETAGQDVSSARAREIAVSLIKQNY